MLWPPGKAQSDGPEQVGGYECPFRGSWWCLFMPFILLLQHISSWAACWDAWGRVGWWRQNVWARWSRVLGTSLWVQHGLTDSCSPSLCPASRTVNTLEVVLNLVQPHECPSRSKSQRCLCFNKPKEALLGHVLDASLIQLFTGWQKAPSVSRDLVLATQVEKES